LTVVTATAPALWRAEKSVLIDGHSTHRHKPSPVSDGFKPPSMPRELRIRPEVLAAAMARTLTLRTAPDVMLAHWTRSQFAEIEYLITNGPQFQLSPFITALADAERSGFAGRVGAGMCDLVMNVLGYVWRDNASCLSSKAAKHADFIYAGGAATGHGVVLTEAHGSFAQSVTKTTISGEARRKYRRQVKPHVATSCTYGNVVHGYSIAFGCNPAPHDTHLHVAETEVTMPRGKVGLRRSPGGQPGAGQVPISIALATYRSNFLLMGAWRVVAWIDWLLGRGVRPEVDLATTFYAFELSGETLLVTLEDLVAYLRPWLFTGGSDGLVGPWLNEQLASWSHQLQFGAIKMFAMNEWAAKSFLSTFSRMLDVGREQTPQTLDLPTFVPFGLLPDPDRAGGDRSRQLIAQFRDGLALVGGLPPPLPRRYTWSADGGLG